MKRETHGKVIPVRIPGQRRRRVTVFVGILAVILLVIAFFAVEGGKNWDAVRRFTMYGTQELRFTLDTGADMQAELDGGLVTIGSEGITAYQRSGSVRFMATVSLDCPVIRSGEKNLLIYDAGGTDFLILDAGGNILRQENAPGAIFDADLAADGSACYISAGDRVRTVLSVYDKDQLPFYSVMSSSRYFSACAVSEGADYVCVVAMGQENGLFASSAVIYKTDREEPVAELSLGNQMIYDLCFWEDRICALGESAVTVFTLDGEKIGSVACEGVSAFDLGGDGFCALIVPGDAGQELITVNKGARIVGRRALGDAPAVIDVSGKYVACLTENSLVLSGQKLDPWAQTQEIGTAGAVCVSASGAVYLLSVGSAERFLP